MTTEEAKKAGFRIDAEGWATTWRILKTEKIRRLYSKVRGLDAKDFPTRAKARDELKRRKAEASANRVEARVAARKAAGTQAPPPETPEQRDARLKATYEGYRKVGGPITKEQLTGEMREWMHRGSYPYWTGFASDGISPYANAVSCQMGIGTPAMPSPFPNQIEHGRVFWTRADAEHDHFLRTWKGRVTKECGKNLRDGDELWEALVSGNTQKVIVHKKTGLGIEKGLGLYCLYLSESEAKAAAHDLWLADRRENQMEAISEEQRKMLKASDACYFIDFCGCVDSLDADECLYHEAKVYFSAKAAQAALDKAKQPEHKFAESVASHATPSDESQAKEVSTDETQTILEEAMKCVCGPRRRDYGTPDENFARIAALWSIQLKKQITVDDVAMCMILMKVARQANTPKRDNLVDIAGYAQCASELTHNK